MQAAILQLDNSLRRQPMLEAHVRSGCGRVMPAEDLGASLRLWTRWETLAALRDRLLTDLPGHSDLAEVVFAGSGDFHHITPLLVERAIARSGGPVTVLHFDNHPDWVRRAAGRHCGSWVGPLARSADVARVITIGVCSADIGRNRSRQGDLALIDEDRLHVYP